MSFKYNLKNQCPACSGRRNDCRYNTTIDAYHCRIDPSLANPDVKYVGHDANGFGMYQIASNTDTLKSGNKLIQSIKTKKQVKFDTTVKIRKQEKQEEKQERSPLPVIHLGLTDLERHHAILHILNQLDLTWYHKKELKARGLTNTQVDHGWFRSVDRDHYLLEKADDRLAGVKIGGQQLNTNKGIICPIRNANGLFIGWQIKNDNHKADSGFPKYLWAACETWRRDKPDSPKSQLNNGELPINFCFPYLWKQTEWEAVGLVEGILKPYIAACQQKMIFIGASGGNFFNAKEQIAEFIKLYPQLKKFRLYPDAGAVMNENVMTAYQKTYLMFKAMGIEIDVAWWWQTTKEDNDIDELDGFEPVMEFITWQEFLKIAADKGVHPRVEVELVENQLALDFANTDNQNLKELTTDFVANANTAKSQLTVAEAKKEKLAKAASLRWKEGNKFTPTQVINSQFVNQGLNLGDIPKKSIIGIKSGLGTGKTTAVLEALDLWNSGAVFLGHRNSLMYQIAEKCGGSHIRDEDADIQATKDIGKLVLCIDSIGKFSGKESQLFKGRTIVIDELMSFLIHFLTTRKFSTNRSICIQVFQNALRQCDRIVVLDGHLTDWAVEYIRKLAGDSWEVIKVENQHKPAPFNITILDGAIKEGDYGDKIDKKDKSPLVDSLVKAVELGQKVVVCADSLDFLKYLDKRFQATGKTGLSINSDTITEKCKSGLENQVMLFLKNPTDWINENKPDYVLYSPTAESGVDIAIKDYFDKQYCFFNNVINASASMQMIARLRDSKVERFIWISETCPGESYEFADHDAGAVKESHLLYFNEYLTALMTGEENQEELFNTFIEKIRHNADSCHTNIFALLTAKLKYEKINGKKCLIELLQQAGHNVKFVQQDTSEEEKEATKEGVRAIRMERCTAIASPQTKLLDDGDYTTLRMSYSLSEEEKNQVEKKRIDNLFPGITETEIFSKDFVYKVNYEEKDWMPSLHRYFLFNEFLKAEESNQDSISLRTERNKLFAKFNNMLRTDNYDTFIKDISGNYVKFRGLYETGIHKLFVEGFEWTKESPEFKEVIKKFQTVDVQLKLEMRTYVAKERRVASKISDKKQIEFIKKWAEWLGYPIKSTGRGIYTLDMESAIARDRVVALELLEKKYQEYVEKEKIVVLGKIETPEEIIASEVKWNIPELKLVVNNEIIEETMSQQTELVFEYPEMSLQMQINEEDEILNNLNNFEVIEVSGSYAKEEISEENEILSSLHELEVVETTGSYAKQEQKHLSLNNFLTLGATNSKIIQLWNEVSKLTEFVKDLTREKLEQVCENFNYNFDQTNYLIGLQQSNSGVA